MVKKVTLEEAENALQILKQYQVLDRVAAALASSTLTADLMYSIIQGREATIASLKRWIAKNQK